MSPSSLNFGNQAVGTASTTQTVTFTNTSQVTLTMGGIVSNAPFGVQTTTCPANGFTLGAGSSCTADIVFSPIANGKINGTISFFDNAPTSPQL